MPKLGYTIAAVVMALASVAVAATPDTKPGPAPECKPIEDSLADLASLIPVTPKRVKVDTVAGLAILVADMKEQLGEEVKDEEGHDILKSDRFDILVAPGQAYGFVVASSGGCYTAASPAKASHLYKLIEAVSGTKS